jgi:hypothetical protein
MSALPGISDIDLLGNGKCIINFDAEVAHCAFNFGMAQEQLDSSEITCPAIYQRRFGSAQGMSAENTAIQSDSGDPLRYQSRILTGRYAAFGVATTGEQEIARSLASEPEVIIIACRVCSVNSNLTGWPVFSCRTVA